jgi:hypothetical protein
VDDKNKNEKKLSAESRQQHPNAKAPFCASDMVSHVNSNACHLSESKARSPVPGCHCLGSHLDKLNGKTLPFNGSVNILCSNMLEIV